MKNNLLLKTAKIQSEGRYRASLDDFLNDVIRRAERQIKTHRAYKPAGITSKPYKSTE